MWIKIIPKSLSEYADHLKNFSVERFIYFTKKSSLVTEIILKSTIEMNKNAGSHFRTSKQGEPSINKSRNNFFLP
jgi:hypothetical protein